MAKTTKPLTPKQIAAIARRVANNARKVWELDQTPAKKKAWEKAEKAAQKAEKKAADKAPAAPKAAAPSSAVKKQPVGVINGVKVYRETQGFSATAKGKTVTAHTYMGMRLKIRKAK